MSMPSTHSRDMKAIRQAVEFAKRNRGNYMKISDLYPRSDKALAGMRRSLLRACQNGSLNEAGLEVCFDHGWRGMEWSFRALRRGAKVPNQFSSE